VAKLGRLCAALLFTCALSSSCLACSCVCREPRSFKAAVAQRFNSYPTIFIGTVIEATAERKTVTLAPGHVFPAITYRARFTVEEVFKGATTPILISNNGASGTCGYGEMETGKSYLVYASQPEPDSTVYIGSCCNRTRPLLMDDPRITNHEKRAFTKEVELLRKLAARNRKHSAN
jgi:hypothetical protein